MELIGIAPVSAKAQEVDRQIQNLLASGVHRDDFCINYWQSGALFTRVEFSEVLNSSDADDRLFITTLDGLGSPTQTVFDLAEDLRTRDIILHVFHLSCRAVGTKSHMGAMVFAATSTLAQMDLAIKTRTSQRLRFQAPPHWQ